MSRRQTRNGFTLIEVILVIVIFGILATVAMRSGQKVFQTAKVEETRQELDALAEAIVGNAGLQNNGIRADFGYVGDVGSLPPNLDALVLNPGGYVTWNGPYIGNRYTQLASDYKNDAWNTAYSYSGGATITSTGSGSNIVRRLANSTSDLLYNSVSGNVFDADGTPPGTDNGDSVMVRLMIPNGVGGMATRTTSTDAGGYFQFDSIPIGTHDLVIVYEPADDTLMRLVTVLPRSDVYAEYRPNQDYWHESDGSISGLVGHWKLDETSDTVVSDASGYGNHGATRNMAGSPWTNGKISGALEFDGSNDYVQIPHSDELNGTDALTYSAWVYAHGWSGTSQVMAKSVHGGGTGRAQMGIFSEGGVLKGRAETVDGRREVSTSLTTLNAWVHVALVFDGTSLNLYVDGILEGDYSFAATTLIQTTDPLNFSKRVGTSQYYFDGLIDDVRVYNRALSLAEIQALSGMGM